jgi:Bacterial protein of unknown function (DUF853)
MPSCGQCWEGGAEPLKDMAMTKQQDDKELRAGAQDQRQTAHGSQPRRRSGYQRQSVGEAIAKSFIRSIASSLGRILARAITGRGRTR